jgi:hypothetical protein
MIRSNGLALAVTVLLCFGLVSAASAGDTAPVGPPWEANLADAQQRALKNNTPIFVYFTKTICPHCEPVEKGVLPSPGLKPGYGAVSWLFNTRDFSGSPKDKAAELVELRFGVSSYPQLLLVHPETLTVITSMGRTERELLRSFAESKIEVGNAKLASERLMKAEAAVASLVKENSAASAKKALLDRNADIVVQFVALEILAEESPQDVVGSASTLLQVPHDQFRNLTCNTLAKVGDPKAEGPLAKLLADPGKSLNPNVVRIHAAKALARCGTKDSVAALVPFASTGAYNNSLTFVSLDALAEIAARDNKAAVEVKKVLLAIPKPPASADPRELARSKALTERIQAHLNKLNEK